MTHLTWDQSWTSEAESLTLSLSVCLPIRHHCVDTKRPRSSRGQRHWGECSGEVSSSGNQSGPLLRRLPHRSEVQHRCYGLCLFCQDVLKKICWYLQNYINRLIFSLHAHLDVVFFFFLSGWLGCAIIEFALFSLLAVVFNVSFFKVGYKLIFFPMIKWSYI